jgi:hypothetical protein
MLARVVVAAILLMTLAHQIACQSSVTGNESLNATQAVNSNLTFVPLASTGGLPQAVYYSLAWNVSDATSVNTTFQVYVDGALQKTYQSVYTTENPAALTSSASGLLDPCQSSVSENTTVVVNFDAVTNGVSGDAVLTAGAVEIPAIQNATAFDFKCGVAPNLGEPCDFFYTLDVNVTAGDMVLLYASASSAANVSLGSGACPSADAFVTLDATEILLANVTSSTKFWVAARVITSLALPQLTFNMIPVTLPPSEVPVATAPLPEPVAPVSETPQEGPVANAPVLPTPTTAPGNDNNNELPTWATALLIVFGLLVGVLLIVVIVLCVKNRRRANYNTV